jgi:hypothetical protein
MRTTIRIDDETLAELKARAREEQISLTELANRILRLGLEAKRPKRRRVRIQPVDMGPPKLDLDKALDLAGELEDEEILRKLSLRK